MMSSMFNSSTFKRANKEKQECENSRFDNTSPRTMIVQNKVKTLNRIFSTDNSQQNSEHVSITQVADERSN